MKNIIAACATVSLLSACAGSPARLGFADAKELAQQSNYNLCRASASMYANRAMDAEIARRGVDCAPHIAAAAADKQARIGAALLFSAQQQQQRQQQQAYQPMPDLFPKRTHCENFGNGVQCTQY